MYVVIYSYICLKYIHMERMIEVKVSIYDEEELNRYLKSKADLSEYDDDEMSKIDRLVHQANHGTAPFPTPVIGKFRFCPSSLVGIQQTYSLKNREEGSRDLDSLILIFNTGAEQVVDHTLEEWDVILDTYTRIEEARILAQQDEMMKRGIIFELDDDTENI